jgi:hypothetical protein
MQDSALLSGASKQLAEWTASADAMKKSFLDDLKSVLSREQESRWPLVERELRRPRMLGRGILLGESVDVLGLLDEAVPEALSRDRIAELAESYAQELDRAMVTRAGFLAEHEDAFAQACTDKPGEAERLWKESRRLRGAVRDLHEQFVRRFAEELSPEEGKKLTDLYFARCYSRLLRPTRADAYLTTVLGLESLNGEQAAALKEISRHHESARMALIKQMADLERALDDSTMPAALARALGEKPSRVEGFDGKQKLPLGHPLLKLRESRYSLDRRTRMEIDKVLTEDQQREIPMEARAASATFEDYQPMGL